MEDNYSQDYFSYTEYEEDDITEPTPVPNTFRPPLPSQHPEESQSPIDLSLLDKSLFSFSVGGTLTEDGSTPTSFPHEPPSPLSRPSASLLDGKDNNRYLTRGDVDNSHNRQPPIAEVHVENEDEDAFYECVDDKSLAERTKRSLLVATPQPKNVSLESQRSQGRNRTTTPSLSPMASSSVSYSSSLFRKQHMNVNSSNRTFDPTSDDVVRVHESALQALMRLKEELLRANDRNDALEEQQRVLMEEKDKILDSFHQTHLDLEEKEQQLKDMEMDRKEWQREKTRFESQLRSSTREKKDAMHRKVAADNRQKDWKVQLDTLRLKLEEAVAAKEEVESDMAVLQSANDELQKENDELTNQLGSQVEADSDKIKKLRLELEAKDEELEQLKSGPSDTQELREQLETLQKEHEDTLKDMDSLHKLLRNKKSSIRFQQEDSEASTLDTSIADRLARMRDSAERAHLIRVHKRELARLKLDQEAELQTLVTSHDEAMRKAAKQAKSAMNQRLEEVKATLRDEYEEKMEEVEHRHKQKFLKMQQKYMRSQEDADEAVRLALNKASAVSHEYEREGLDMLTSKLESEKQKLKEHYESQQEKLRRQWEEERDTLLSVIQKDCNAAFETRRKTGQPSAAPRLSPSSLESISSFKSFPAMAVTVGRVSEETTVPKPLISPASYSDIDSVLNETEALIQSIM